MAAEPPREPPAPPIPPAGPPGRYGAGPGPHGAPPAGGYPGQPWYGPPPAGWYAPKPTGPANDSAVAGFVLAISAGAVLLFSSGIGAPLSVILAILAIVFSRSGKRKVDTGQIQRHRGLAQAGLIVGIVALVLSILAALAWIGLIVLAATVDDFDGSTGPDRIARATLAAALLRPALGMA